MFDWKQLLLGKNDWASLASVAFRSGVMFAVILFGLRLLGKRGIQQLSVFELGVIVGLGSAAGDPMFYRDVGLLSCFVVFGVVLALYLVLERVIEKSDRLATVLEGRPAVLVRDGRIVLDALEREPLSRPELFTQLRLRGVSHRGQVRLAVLEPPGSVSIFFRADVDVTAGLPILPDSLEEPTVSDVMVPGTYSCRRCGAIASFERHAQTPCPTCHACSWIRAADEKRLS